MVWCFVLAQFCKEHLKLFIMKKLLLLLVLLQFSNLANAQAVQDWTSGIPTLAGYNNHLIVSDSQGNVYTVGKYDGAVRDFDSGPGVSNMSAFSGNMYILKVNAAGNFVWAKQIGGPTTFAISNATSIAIDASDNIYVSGSSNKIIASGNYDFDPGTSLVNVANPTSHYVMYVLKLDSNGNHVWNAQFQNPTNTQYDRDAIYSMKVDNSGNLYATGTFNGTVDFDPSSTGVNSSTSVATALSTDVFILKLNSTGGLVWAKALQNSSLSTGSKFDKGIAIDVDSAGNVYTTGYYWDSVDADPGAGVHNLVAYTSSNPQISGGNTQYISKLSANGDFVWAYDLVGGHNDAGLPNLAVDSADNVIVTGDSFGYSGALRDFDFGSGTADLPVDSGSWVLKINSNAGFIWVKSTAVTIGSINSSSSISPGLTLDALGNIYTTGTFGYNGPVDFDPSAGTYSVTSAGSYDGFVSKLDTNGNFLWVSKLGGTGLEICYSIALSPLGKVTVSGSTNAGFNKLASIVAVTTGGFLASYTQPALANNQFELDKNILVYPNPANSDISVKFKNLMENGTLKIISLTGQTVFEKQHFSGTDFSFDVSYLSAGLYLIQVSDGNNSYNSKFVKE